MSDVFKDPIYYIDEFGTAWHVYYQYDIDGNIVNEEYVLA